MLVAQAEGAALVALVVEVALVQAAEVLQAPAAGLVLEELPQVEEWGALEVPAEVQPQLPAVSEVPGALARKPVPDQGCLPRPYLFLPRPEAPL